MRLLVTAGLLSIVVFGCAAGPSWPPTQPVGGFCENPVFVPSTDHHHVWETVADVVDDYFEIAEEEPVRLIGDTLTEGRLETFPKVGATVFEPWLHDSANAAERMESTLQSIRRRATVTAMPTQGGYLVEVTVLKELEDVVRPEHSTAGAATFRYDESLTRVVNPSGGQDVGAGWIIQGRDAALEQRILGHLKYRFGGGALPRGGYYAPM